MSIVDGAEPCPSQFLLDEARKSTTVVAKKGPISPKLVQYYPPENVLSSIYGLNTSRQEWTSTARLPPNQGLEWLI